MMSGGVPGDFILAHGEEYRQCPYNLAHNVTNARLIVHLDKCRRNYIKMMKEAGQPVDMKPCKFNWTHMVPSPEIEYHEQNCSDRYHVVESMRYHQSEEFRKVLEEEKIRKENDAQPVPKFGIPEAEDADSHTSRNHKHKKHSKKHKDVKPKVEENIWGSDAEDWEADSQGYEPGYDPGTKLQNDIVLYHPRGLSKSERKTFRLEQRQRAAQPMPQEEMDVKPFSKLEVKDPKLTMMEPPSAPKPVIAAPLIKPEPVAFKNDEKEDGECSDEEFYGEDPFG